MTTITMDGKYQTRDGRPVRILCVDAPMSQPIVGMCLTDVHASTTQINQWHLDGVFDYDQGETEWDLIPVPPAPRMVPLGPEDVPPGSVLRLSWWNSNSWIAVDKVIESHAEVYFSGSTKSLASLMTEKWFIKRPGEDWQKCEKPEC